METVRARDPRSGARIWLPSLAAALCMMGFAGVVHAQPLAREDVPMPLVPWVDWALDGADSHGCAWLPNGERRCRWTSALEIALTSDGASFTMDVFADRDRQAFDVVGNPRHWPLNVTVDETPYPVEQASSGSPLVRLNRGAHRIRGVFRWSEQPETLTLPSSIARVRLSTARGPVDHPRVDFSARTLWLQTVQREAAEQDTLSVEVYRRLEDGASIRVLTRLVLHVSGRPREIDLGDVLLDSSLPIEVQSEIPLHIGEDRNITVQAHPGSFDIDIVAIVPSPETELRAPRHTETDEWPEQEIWVWVADEALRQTELSGPALIDPDRTNLPSEWRGLPTFLVTSESTLHITTRRRGNPNPSPNRINLRREIWLDPDGTGLTGRDSLSGRMNRDWRLDFLAGELGRAQTHGDPHLISSIEGRTGIEIRRGSLEATAEWRNHEAATDFLAVGWDQDVQSLQTTLYLAPGWQLLAANGVDRVESSWITSWTLWGLFFVLIVSVTLARLGGIVLGLTTLLAVTLCYHEPGAPFELWIPLIVVLALARALPNGSFRQLFRVGYGILFALLALNIVYFSGNELRRGLWPHTVRSASSAGYGMLDGATAAVTEAEESVSYSPRGSWDSYGGSPAEPAQQMSRSRNLTAYEANAVLQTGPGLPSWNARGGRRIELNWTGPVTADTQVVLWLVPPWIGALLSVLRVLLLGALLYLLSRIWPPAERPNGSPGKPPVPVDSAAPESVSVSMRSRFVVASVSLSVLLLAASNVHAQSLETDPGLREREGSETLEPGTPSTPMLQTLRRRLTRAPECHPRCANIGTATFTIENAQLRIEADVNASAVSAFPIPGPVQDWMPRRILVGEREATAITRLEDGFLYVRVEPGVHRVTIEGDLPSSDAFVLSQAMIPHRVLVSVPDNWTVQGRRNGEQAGNSLQFIRQIESAGVGETGQRANQVRPWLELRREYELGIRWEVHTTVRRVSATGNPILARIPLLDGESVTSADIPVEEGSVVLSLGGNETERSWHSVLQPREELVLRAENGAIANEIWSFAPGPVWRADFDGISPVRTVDEDGYWNPLYRPFSGDELTLRIQRLEAAEGRSVTIDAAHLEVTPGARLTAGTLSFTVRSSIGATHSITLPEDATLTSIRVNEQTRFAEQRGREVSFTLPPGENSIRAEFQEPHPLGFRYRVSEIALSSDAVNIEVTIHRPDRWVLWLSGPDWGPSVLFWPYLLIVLIVSVLLARLIPSPLKSYDWVLLGLGISQLPIWLSWILPSWIALITWREKRPSGLPTGIFDLRQLAIIFWTLVSAVVLYAVIHIGLLVDPDTAVTPYVSGRLDWFVDRLGGQAPFVIPRPVLYSLPVWTYHVAMLVWSIWLATRVVGWAQWAFRAFGKGGYWEMRPRASNPTHPAQPEFGLGPTNPSVANQAAAYPATPPGYPGAANQDAASPTPGRDDSGKT